MEIISYVIEGGLTHKDNLGTQETLYPGEVQYMSAGTGVIHSEFNQESDPLRFIQLWVVPDAKGHTPQYGSVRFKMDERQGNWLHMVSPMGAMLLSKSTRTPTFIRPSSKPEKI
jgi:redox-sensitive bicupin YhaK (pirin superfamily)